MKDEMLQVTLVRPGKFEISHVPVPKPGRDEVLIEVRHVGLCGSDATIYRGLHPYAISPLIMGHEFSGYIAALGEGVTDHKVGERVAVIPHLVCGKCDMCMEEKFNFCEQLRCTGAEAHGAHREYIVMPSCMAIPIPDNMSLEDAALLEPACVAFHGSRRPGVKKGENVLVIGAGAIGNFAMQSVKALGAGRVFIADMDETRLALAEKLGADGTINVGKETLAEGLTRLCGSTREVSLFYDCVGGKGQTINDIISIARRGSRIGVIGVLQNGYDIPLLPDFVQHELSMFGTTMYTPEDYRLMIELISSGKIRTEGVISHRFPLEKIPEVFTHFIDERAEPFFKIMFDV